MNPDPSEITFPLLSVFFSVSGEGDAPPEPELSEPLVPSVFMICLHPTFITKVWKPLAQVPLVHPATPVPSQV